MHVAPPSRSCCVARVRRRSRYGTVLSLAVPMTIATTIVLLLVWTPAAVAAGSPVNASPRWQHPAALTATAERWQAPVATSFAQPTAPVSLVPTPLPVATPLAPLRPATAPLPPSSLTVSPNNPLAWMGVGLNPGKWLLDSVLGATTGMIYSIAAVLETFARFANGQIVDLNGQITNTSDQAFGFLFTTPEALTVAWGGASSLGSPQALHDLMRQVALSLLVLVCTYRLLLLMMRGNVREDLIDLGTTFIAGLVGIQGAWWVCTLCIRAANLITERAVAAAFGGGLGNWLPMEPQQTFWSSLGSIQGVSLTIAIVTILYWGTLALLAVHALIRIVMVNLMLIISPFAGLALATGGGWNYARVWFFRFVELLATPLIWGMTLGFGRALLSGFGVTNQPILGPLLAIVTMLMVFQAPRLLGFAAQEAVGGARNVWRMAGRAAMVTLTAPGGAGGGAVGAAAGAAGGVGSPGIPPGPAPTTPASARASASGSGGGRDDGDTAPSWDGPAFGGSLGALPRYAGGRNAPTPPRSRSDEYDA